jgi:hypothetical protein
LHRQVASAREHLPAAFEPARGPHPCLHGRPLVCPRPAPRPDSHAPHCICSSRTEVLRAGKRGEVQVERGGAWVSAGRARACGRARAAGVAWRGGLARARSAEWGRSPTLAGAPARGRGVSSAPSPRVRPELAIAPAATRASDRGNNCRRHSADGAR